jgi:ABC-type transport system substrate-binding protein
VTRQWFRSMVLAASLAAVLAAGSLLVAAPASAASSGGASVATRPTCGSSADIPDSTVDPLNGAAGCARGPTSVEQRYEAAIAAAGLLVFGGAAIIYRRRHPRGPGGLGPRAPQGGTTAP